jgi:hypothetical protein
MENFIPIGVAALIALVIFAIAKVSIEIWHN